MYDDGIPTIAMRREILMLYDRCRQPPSHGNEGPISHIQVRCSLHDLHIQIEANHHSIEQIDICKFEKVDTEKSNTSFVYFRSRKLYVNNLTHH